MSRLKITYTSYYQKYAVLKNNFTLVYEPIMSR